MNTQVLVSILKADYQERTRRAGFRLTLCLALMLGYSVNSGQILIKLGVYRGVYNSAWVGSLMALVITFFLGLVGFFLVKDTIERDERSGVGQILATTALTRPQYLFGKWLSSVAILTTLIAILAAAAVFMQLIYREVPQLQLWALIAPFLFIAFPMMTLVAALAVFFEAVRWLKGGFGNLVYFFLFSFLLVAGLFFPWLGWIDVIGMRLISTHMRAAAAALPGYDGSFTLAMISGNPLQTFVWSGVEWTAPIILQRLLWIGASVGVVLLAGLFFNRFDPFRRSNPRRAFLASSGDQAKAEAPAPAGENIVPRLSPLAGPVRFRYNLAGLVWWESALLVKGLKWYVLAGMAAVWLAGALTPTEALRKLGFMLAAIGPVLLWSSLGEREIRHHAEELIYQSAYASFRPFISSWVAGVLFTALVLSGSLLGRLIYSTALMLLPWAISVLFIPTLALCLGVWSRSGKAFQVVYPILWWLGPFNPENGLPILDYLGIHTQAPVNVFPIFMLAFVCLLLLLAWIGRRRQLLR